MYPDRRSKLLAFTCVFFLSIDWLIFGSMHFLFKGATIAQIPPYIPFKGAIAAVTGVIEVAIGLLVLVPQTRRGAALVSLFLIIMYVPAVYHMLSSESALAMSPGLQSFFRAFLIPHNLLLALASLYLLRCEKRNGSLF